MSGDTGVCWCASDSKCPHSINSRINGLWNEMEGAVDEVLEAFDRRTIKKYLAKESKPSQTDRVSLLSKSDSSRVDSMFLNLTISPLTITHRLSLRTV